MPVRARRVGQRVHGRFGARAALEGYDTGVDLDALIATAQMLPGIIGHDIPGQVAHAGPRLRLHALADAKAQCARLPRSRNG